MQVVAAMLRQENWRAYNPVTAPVRLATPATVRSLIYSDLLRTMTGTSAVDNLKKSDGQEYTIAG